MDNALRDVLDLMRRGGDGPAVRRALARLKTMLRDAPPDEAAAALIAMLESGEDIPSGLSFTVGAGGAMEEVPSWRTALLDLLGQTDPGQSADYSRAVAATTSSADEYALALRNISWGTADPQSSPELRDLFLAMLARPEWRQQPSPGFLEAFDIGVVAETVPELAGALAEPPGREPPESRAAFVALDRIMLRNPGLLVDAFRADSDFLAQAPMHRASLLSRLDVRDASQAALLADYLLRADHAPGEREYFLEVFPNGNRFAGHRLVTTPEPGGGIGEMRVLDRETQRVVSAWLADPRFASRRAELAGILRRLEAFAAGGSR